MVTSRSIVCFSRVVLQHHLITLIFHFLVHRARSPFPFPRFIKVAVVFFLLAQGQQGNGSPCGPQKQTCHSQAKCLSDKEKEQCRCNDGFQGDGTRCEGLCTLVAF